MGYLEITGGAPLQGEITVQGSKNAVLPILAACLLGEGLCVLENCPVISDVRDTLDMMEELGCFVEQNGNCVRIDASSLKKTRIHGPQAARIRSSVLFLGALLGKMGTAVLPVPGGCAIGMRPIDQHICVLEQLGAEVTVGEEICARIRPEYCCSRKGDVCSGSVLRGARLRLRVPSVGATENAVLAAVAALGETVIENAAQEPEVEELCRFLNLRGADIARCADGSIRIQGGRTLGSVVYSLEADRIVTGTYMLAAAATGGSLCVTNYPSGQLTALRQVMDRMGVRFCAEEQCISDHGSADAQNKNAGLRLYMEAPEVISPVPYVETAPYPGFPTDLQSPLMASLCRADGRSRICEQIFENRFRIVPELSRMGASVRLHGCCAWIDGRKRLRGADLCAPDLRGGAALVIAALQAEGRSVIGRTQYIERGYENIVRDLRLLGAQIEQC